MRWRFLTPFVWFFARERSFVFWTWDALGAIAGAGVMVIFGFFGEHFSIADFFNAAVDEDGMIGATNNDGEAVAGKNAFEFDRVIELGRGPKRELFDVSVVTGPAGAVVTAVFGGRGTIWAVGARRGADEEGSNVCIISTSFGVVGSLEVVAICGSFVFECC